MLNSKRILVITSLLILTYMLLGCNTGEEEIIILPEGYVGYVVIIFNQEDGVQHRYKNGKRVYKIPQNGILKTKFSDNPGWAGFPQFYYKTFGTNSRIPFKTEFKNIPTDSVVAFGGTSGGANKNLAGKKVVRFKKYYIGTKKQIEQAIKDAGELDITILAD